MDAGPVQHDYRTGASMAPSVILRFVMSALSFDEAGEADKEYVFTTYGI